MRRNEAVVLLAVALALLTAGVVWLFGAWGLVGAGAALGVVTMFVNVRED